MEIVIDNSLLVGALVGAILFGALFASPVFRNVALAAAAAGICVIYARDGVDGIRLIASALAADIVRQPQFAGGLAFGSVVVTLLAAALRLRRAP